MFARLELDHKRLEDVAKRIVGFDVLESPTRILVREGRIRKLTSKNKLQWRNLFLFNDIILWTKVSSLSSQCRFRGLMDLKALDVKQYEKAEQHNAFEILTSSANLVCYTTDQADRDLWINDITYAVRALKGVVNLGSSVARRATAVDKSPSRSSSTGKVLAEELKAPMPKPEELDKQFEAFLNEKGFKQEPRAKLLKLPPQQKWMLIIQEKVKEQEHEKTKGDLPEYWAGQLSQEYISISALQTFRVVVSSCNKSWFVTFADHRGMEEFTKAFVRIANRPQNDPEAPVMEFLRICRALVNGEDGLHLVMTQPELIQQIVYSLEIRNDALRDHAFTVLNVIAWVSNDGNNQIYEAFRTYSGSKQQRKFKVLIDMLSESQSAELRLNALIFINTLVNTCDEMERRILIRRELLDFDLLKTLSAMKVFGEQKGKGDPRWTKIRNQIDVFEAELDVDKREVLRKDLDLSDLEASFNFLYGGVQRQGFTKQLMDILHMMLVIPGDPYHGKKIWDNLEFATKVCVFSGRKSLEEKFDPKSGELDAPQKVLSYADLKGAMDEKRIKDSELERVEIVELREAVARDKNEKGTLKNEIETLKATIAKNGEETKAQYERFRTELVKAATDKENLRKVAKAESDQLRALLEKIQKEGGKVPADAIPVSQIPAEGDTAPLPGGLEGKRGSIISVNTGGDGSNIPAPPPPDGNIPLPPDMGIPAPPGDNIPPPPGFEAPPFDAPGIPGPPGVPSTPKPTGLPPKKKVKPSVKMKLFHWNVVAPQFVNETIWKTLSDEGVKLDTTEVESLFCQKIIERKTWHPNSNTGMPGDPANMVLPVSPRSAAKGGFNFPSSPRGAGHAPPPPEHIRLFESQRSNNIDITLSRFKLSHAAIKDAILAMDEKVLDVDKLLALFKIIPSNEEMEILLGYEGETSLLANAERFQWSLLEIKGLKERLEMFLFKQQFNVTAEELELKLDQLERANTAVSTSKNLQQVMQVVLAMGNYLNGSSHQGGAYGFKLATLGKLRSTKTVDNKSNLLAYIVQYVSDKKPEYTKWLQECAVLKEAANIEAGPLEAEVGKFAGRYTQIKAKLESKEEEVPGDQFSKVMKAFYESTRARAERVKRRLDEWKKANGDVMLMFGEPRETKPEEFFAHFATFRDEWLQAYDEMEKARAAALAEKKRLDAQASLLEKKKKNDTIKLGKGGQGKDLVDNVMNAIHSDAQSIRHQIQARRRSVDATKQMAAQGQKGLYNGPGLETVSEKDKATATASNANGTGNAKATGAGHAPQVTGPKIHQQNWR